MKSTFGIRCNITLSWQKNLHSYSKCFWTLYFHSFCCNSTSSHAWGPYNFFLHDSRVDFFSNVIKTWIFNSFHKVVVLFRSFRGNLHKCKQNLAGDYMMHIVTLVKQNVWIPNANAAIWLARAIGHRSCMRLRNFFSQMSEKHPETNWYLDSKTKRKTFMVYWC